ncbi:MAG: DUF523 domain-containing protein [Planctomycetota bacterium]
MTDPEATGRALVSACLLGRACTYKGTHNGDRVLRDELAAEGIEAVPFCPEEHGGLGTPRPPADLTASAEDVLDGRARVVTDSGEDVTGGFLRGARGALETCVRLALKRAYLKERSPSCGCAATHVDGEIVDGPGVTAALLRRNGVECVGVEGRRTGSDDVSS